MYTKRRVMAAKIEAQEGVAETLSASDGGILVINPKIAPAVDMHQRNVARATFSRLPDVPGARMFTYTFRAEMKGAGSAYSASNKPALSPYLRACGFAETVDATPGSEKVTYDPASTGVPSLTMGLYRDGVIHKLRGCRGNVKFLCDKIGAPVFADFEFLAVADGDPVDGALLAPTYEGTVPPPLLSSNFSIASYAALISKFELDMANVLAMRSKDNEEGYLSAAITDRDPQGSFDPEMTLVATHDWYGRWKAGTTGALNIGDVGATQYNKFKITAPEICYRGISDDEREGLDVAGVTYQMASTAGDNEIQIVFS